MDKITRRWPRYGVKPDHEKHLRRFRMALNSPTYRQVAEAEGCSAEAVRRSVAWVCRHVMHPSVWGDTGELPGYWEGAKTLRENKSEWLRLADKYEAMASEKLGKDVDTSGGSQNPGIVKLTCD